jgi:membrane protease YdiL (CAAX protease family)
MLLAAIRRELYKRDPEDRPRLVVFGESLGAHTSQDAFLNEGTQGLEDAGVERALWIGSPHLSKWKTQVLGEPRADTDPALVIDVDNFGEIEQLPTAARKALRYVMITHHNDGVGLFGPDLIIQQPPWLSEPEMRPPSVPKWMRWAPIVTAVQTVIDMQNAMNVVPGEFVANGHDYRADLAHFVREVYDLPCTDEQLGRVEAALRKYELVRQAMQEIGKEAPEPAGRRARRSVSDAPDPALDRASRPTYFGLRRSEWGIAGTSIALNVLVNGVLPERYHIPASLTAAGIVSGFAARAGAGVREQGLAPWDAPKGALYGVAAAVPVAAALAGGLLIGESRKLYGEQRIKNATIGNAAHEVLVRIPLGTALPEELIFRGAVLALLSRYHDPVVANAISSVLFGLWHIAPTIDRLETNAAISGHPPAHQAAWVATAVGATAASGLFLGWLRRRSGSIVAPWLVHSAANGVGYAAGWLSARIAEEEKARETPPD